MEIVQSTIYNKDEVVTRKEYLKNKNKKNNKNKPPFVLMLFIFVLLFYIIFQYNTYQKKYRIVNNIPTEISSLKNYDVYYTTKTYTYNTETVLNYIKSNHASKEVTSAILGLTNINGNNGYVYGLKEGSLVRAKNTFTDGTNSFEELEVIIPKGVIFYSVYKDEVYAFLKGENIETGIYRKDKTNNKYVKIISEDISQILVDDKNIYIANNGTDKNIYSYSKQNLVKKQLTKNKEVIYMIENENTIYYTDKKTNGKIYSTIKNSGDERSITKEGAINIVNDKKCSNGNFCMGIYDNYIYYINTNKNNRLYKAKINGESDEKQVINAEIEKISMLGYSIIYKEKFKNSIYRYEVTSKINSEITSGRIVDFSVSAGIK